MNAARTMTINGVRTSIPNLEGGKVSDLVAYLQGTLVSDTQLIASIKIGGREMTPEMERELSVKAIEDIEPIEVFTAHPKEVVEETLQTLLGFTELLARICRSAAREQSLVRFEREFVRVLDGLEVLAESIDSAKKILRVQEFAPVDSLEISLLELLKVLMTARRSNDEATIRAVLGVGLPENLELWRSEAIPLLIRSRDS